MSAKKILGTIWTLTLPIIVLAQETPPTTLPTEFWPIINRLFSFLFGILLVIAVILFMLAAFTFLTAGGDPAKIETARNQFLWGIIGLFLAALSRGLVIAIRTFLGI